MRCAGARGPGINPTGAALINGRARGKYKDLLDMGYMEKCKKGTW